MRRPKTLDIDDGWAECVSADEHPMRRSGVGLGMMPWLSAAQCRRLAAWLIQAADWIEAKEEGR
jgi:hypothetical protein